MYCTLSILNSPSLTKSLSQLHIGPIIVALITLHICTYVSMIYNIVVYIKNLHTVYLYVIITITIIELATLLHM